MLPGRTDIRDWLERADVFVHSSRWEGFGIVLLEAMLAGLPVVATRVSAVPEVVVDGETGLLVEAGDHAGLATHLEALLTDRERAAALGEAGRQRALTEFSVGRMADRTLAVYDEVLASRRRRWRRRGSSRSATPAAARRGAGSGGRARPPSGSAARPARAPATAREHGAGAISV